MNFRANQFTYLPETKTYVAEASELGIPPGVMRQQVQLDGYDFMYVNTDMDASGEDIVGWRFKPTMATVQRNPSMAGTGVLIIND